MTTLSRPEAINRLRDALAKLTDDEHSICEVAAEKGIFCHGFSQFSDQEMFRNYKWLVKRLDIKNRKQLDEYANMWQLTQEAVLAKPIACDVQCESHDTCKGWDSFDNQTLARFLLELNGEQVEVVGEPAAAQPSSPMTV